MSKQSRRQNRHMPHHGVSPVMHNRSVLLRKRLRRSSRELARTTRAFGAMQVAARDASNAFREFGDAMTALIRHARQSHGYRHSPYEPRPHGR